MRLVSLTILAIFLSFLPVLTAQTIEEIVDVADYFPLITGNWWEFEGVDLKSGGTFKTLLAVGQNKGVCGVTVTPLLFFKDKKYGYWGPDDDLNLEWLLVDFDAKGSKYPDFLWAVGDKRYRRDPANFEELGVFKTFVAYVSDSEYPAYSIFPKQFSKKGTASQQKYHQTKEDRSDCDWIIDGSETGIAKWNLSYKREEICEPIIAGDAIRIRFAEDFGDKGWLEDWYFARDAGPIKIETFSRGQKLTENMPVMQRLELKAYYVKTRNGQIKSVR